MRDISKEISQETRNHVEYQIRVSPNREPMTAQLASMISDIKASFVGHRDDPVIPPSIPQIPLSNPEKLATQTSSNITHRSSHTARHDHPQRTHTLLQSTPYQPLITSVVIAIKSSVCNDSLPPSLPPIMRRPISQRNIQSLSRPRTR